VTLKATQFCKLAQNSGCNFGNNIMHKSDMLEQIQNGKGFIAALDQSGGSTPKALAGYGVAPDAFSNDDEMFALIHDMRVRIMTSDAFSGERVIGAILFEKTMDGTADGQAVPAYLQSQGVVPFLKVDKGLEDEADGVQMMKPIDGLEELLARAATLGVFGTKMRSVINLASPSGIAAIVKQQFEVAGQIIGCGMMPMIEPEISIGSPQRAEADQILLAELLKALDALPVGQKVMLKLTLPVVADTFAPLVDHANVVRVVALSGGFSRTDACAELAKNRGVIASFSRALLAELRHPMSDAEFNASLDTAITEIHSASIA
jgi:fructose-bisphosphate aldolase, class I